MSKLMEFICPECGEDIFIDELDATIEDMMAYIKMTCCNCGVEWTEVFCLSYNGYVIDGKIWNKNGEKIV